MNLGALKSVSFRYYVFGNFFALNAIWVFRITLSWLAWDMTHSGAFVGLVAFVYFAPSIPLSPVFGVLVDRINVQYAAFLTQLGMLVIATFSALLHMNGWLTESFLVVMSALTGLIVSAHHPVRLSMAPRLVDRTLVPSVVGITSINFNLARTISPAFGGFLIASIGVTHTLWLVCVGFIPFLVAITRLQVREFQRPAKEHESMFASFLVGLGQVRNDQLIAHAMMLSGLISLLVRGVLEILPVVADGVYDAGVGGFGALASMAGAGALGAGAVIAISQPQSGQRITMRIYAVTIIGLLCLPLFGLVHAWTFALFLAAVCGFCGSYVGVSLQTLIQQNLEDHMRGRVMSLWIVVGVGGVAMGATILGFATDLIGFTATTIGFGALSVLLLVANVMRRG